MNEIITDDIMTLADIEKKFEKEWVLIEDPKLNKNNEVVSGKVLFHSKNRDELDAAAMQLRPKYSAFIYTGPMPDNIFINL